MPIYKYYTAQGCLAQGFTVMCERSYYRNKISCCYNGKNMYFHSRLVIDKKFRIDDNECRWKLNK